MIELRDLDSSDRDRLFEWRNLPEIRRWMYTDHVIRRAEHDLWFDSVLTDESKRYWVILHDRNPVGIVSLVGLGADSNECQLGIYVAESVVKEVRVAEFSLRLVLEYAFLEDGTSIVSAEALEGNVRAISLYSRLGMRQVGRGIVIRNGKRAVRMEISNEEWNQSKVKMGFTR